MACATLVCAWLCFSSIPVLAEVHRDPKAVAILQAVQQTIAPDEGWSKVSALRFTFAVVKNGNTQAEVHHLWNVRTGDYRVQWKGSDGNEKLVIFNVGTKAGKAWLRPVQAQAGASAEAGGKPNDAGGKPGDAGTKPGGAASSVAAAAVAASWTPPAPDGMGKMMETGYGRFINDTYWLLMPLKMNDPGVNVDYDGEVAIDGATYDVIKLTFDHVGLTPGDTYWVDVNRKTHLIDRWQYVLEGETPKPAAPVAAGAPAAAGEPKPPERTTWIWKNWEQFGPIRLSTEKTLMGDKDKVSILLEDVAVLPSLPAGSFDPPK